MTLIDSHSLAVIVSPVGAYLDPTDATITLDEGWSPYAQASVTCAMPPEPVLDLLDLRSTPLRLDLRARQDFASAWQVSDLTGLWGGSVAAATSWLGGRPLSAVFGALSTPWNAAGRRQSTSRRFDLLVTERSIDHQAGTITLTAASDEALLHSLSLVASTPWDPATTSVRAIVDRVLDLLGATLQEGDADGTVAQEATVWKPGDKAIDYLEPMLQAVDLKLWCDEQRRWWLSERRPTVPGAVTLNPSATITELTDTMAVTGDVWYDAVVIRYRWVDQFDLNQEAFDAAGPADARNVYVLDYTTPYPGPGAAAGILNRAQGRGRVLDVRAISDYRVQPGMAATITPPTTDSQTGYVSSVSFNFPDYEMNVATRGLVDTPPTSWLYAPAGLAWNDVPAGTSWLEYTPELIGA